MMCETVRWMNEYMGKWEKRKPNPNSRPIFFRITVAQSQMSRLDGTFGKIFSFSFEGDKIVLAPRKRNRDKHEPNSKTKGKAIDKIGGGPYRYVGR